MKTTKKENQFEVAEKNRIVLDGITYTVKVFFRSDTKETRMDMIMQLVKKEMVAKPLPKG